MAHRNEFSTETGINFAVSLRFMGNNEMREKGEKVDYSRESTFSCSWACALDTVFPMYFLPLWLCALKTGASSLIVTLTLPLESSCHVFQFVAIWALGSNLLLAFALFP